MTAILAQISLAFGLLMFIISAVIGYLCEVDPLVIIFRAVVVMCVSTVVMSLFFKYFVSIIYQFVAEKILDQTRSKGGLKAPGPAKSGGAQE